MIKLFINQKWNYVVTDDKVPASSENEPYFSSVHNKRYSYISLIEKAYAKVHGSYRNALAIKCPKTYIVELTNMLPK